jgi:hypothetical protein
MAVVVGRATGKDVLAAQATLLRECSGRVRFAASSCFGAQG